MNADRFSRRRLLSSGYAVAAAAAGATSAAGAELCASPAGVAEADFRAYMAAFNARDMPGFTRFYTDDVVFVLGERKPMVGRAAIIDWYRLAWSKIREHCHIAEVIVGPHGLAAELHTTFTAIEDWPDFGPQPFLKGQEMKRIGFVHYRTRGDRFAEVKTALHRLVSAPWLRQS